MSTMTPALGAAFMLGIVSLTSMGCNSAHEPVRNHIIGSADKDNLVPPEIRCTAAEPHDGQVIVRLQIRNVGTETIHILADPGMPYQLARDSNTLVIIQGINKPEADVVYEMAGVPSTRPLTPGRGLAWDVPIGSKMLQDHYLRRPAPASLQHGTIHVRCEVGWGPLPTRTDQMSLDEVLAWQRIEGYGPFDIVLP
jgi:hypothetical protein